MDDLIKTMKVQLYERVSSPLTSSFVLSWCAWNFRLIAVMLSSMDPAKKFTMIDTVLYPDMWTTWLHLAIGPIVTSCLYVFLYPFPEGWAFKWAKRKQNDLRSFQANLDSEVPLTPEQSRELRLKCKKTVEDTQSIVNEHQERVKELAEEIYALKTNLSQKDQTIAQLEKRAGIVLLSDDQAMVLRALKGGAVLWDQLKSTLTVNASLTLDDALNELFSMNCARQFDSRTPNGSPTKAWAITQSGLQALARHEDEKSIPHVEHPKLTGT